MHRLKLLPLLLLIVLLGACSQLAAEISPGDAVDATIQPALEETAPPEVQSQPGETRQWAIEAQASSEFAADEWSVEQVLGPPDTPRCGDYQSAWATAASDSEAWLEVAFPRAVHTTAVNVVQSFNPNQVVSIELIGDDGRALRIYDNDPVQVNRPCPFTLSVAVDATVESYDRVRISLDQSVLGLGWNQIDAVELVGITD